MFAFPVLFLLCLTSLLVPDLLPDPVFLSFVIAGPALMCCTCLAYPMVFSLCLLLSVGQFVLFFSSAPACTFSVSYSV